MSLHLKVHVHPDSRKEAVEKTAPDRLVIHVKDPAEDNMANKRVLKIIKSLYPDTRIKIITGHHLPRKLILVEDSN